MTQKNIYIVLGPARSGTSAITRGLKALGIQLGNKLTEAAPWNPVGFWEDNELVYGVNEKVINELHMRWDSVKLPAAHMQTSEVLHEAKKFATQLLHKRLDHVDHWGFKDPRTAKLLPFWQSVFKSLSIQEHYVIALRHPLSCAESYQKMTGADLAHAMLLWITHLIASIDGTQGKKRVILSYDLLMQVPNVQLQRVQNAFNLKNANEAEVDNYAAHFLDQKLQHHDFTMQDFTAHPIFTMFPICQHLYALLLSVANDEMNLESAEFNEKWSAIKAMYDAQKPLYAYIDDLLMQNHALTHRAKKLNGSRLWKMMYPLRVIDNTLKVRRQRANALKKKIAFMKAIYD